MIGIVGGVGPYAGIDLAQKMLDETKAHTDQEHLPFLLLSLPGEITDRTAFLKGKAKKNPGIAIAKILAQLSKAGATVAGIPCNTAHTPAIFSEIGSSLAASGEKIKILHMIEETADFITAYYPKVKCVGIMSTMGTYESGIYPEALKKRGLDPVVLDKKGQQEVHEAIYNPDYGIKAVAHPVTEHAERVIRTGAAKLKDEGVQAMILGCSELALAIQDREFQGLPLIDPTRILARALISHFSPVKLKAVS